MKKYEFTVILNSADEAAKAGLEAVTTAFSEANVEILKQDDLGIKTLAYEIKKQDKAHYYYFDLNAEPSVIRNLEKKFLLNTSILKFLFLAVK